MGKKTISPGKELRDLIKKGVVVLPGAINGLLAKVVEDVGFNALYISGAGLANGAAAMPDIGILTMTEVLMLTGFITRAVNIPCIVDGDTGFGEAVNVIRLIEGLEEKGVAGVHIEDQEMPKKCGHLTGKRLVSTKSMCEKVAAAVEARKDPNFIIIARTDARESKGMKEAIDRAHSYIESGADMIFPEALKSKKEFIEFRKEIKVPLLANMTEFGKTPYLNVKEFEDMGYNLVIFPLTAMRYLIKRVKALLENLKATGTQKEYLNEMYTRQELYTLLGYKDYQDVDKKIRRE